MHADLARLCRLPAARATTSPTPALGEPLALMRACCWALRSAAVRAVAGGHGGARGRWRCCCCRSSCAARGCTGRAMGWLRLAVWGARVICGVRHRVHGMEHLPTAADGHAAVLLAPKHQSTWETFALPDADAAPAGLRLQARAAATSPSSAGRWAGWT
ncbi:MAG: hypothetical protein MZW92_36625 [Comamonadaceae bacterium]|nr:hypothetical protein [Comamonadaceae bacterium]